ncbi:hypothetical protein RCH14_003307 [Massilia sp. MP_M2]
MRVRVELFVNFYKSIEKQFDSDPNFYAIFYELIHTSANISIY